MKVTQSYWKENAEDKRSNREIRAAQERRQNVENDARAAAKSKQTESAVKEDLKFAVLLKSAENPNKPKRNEEDANRQQRDDDKKDSKRLDKQKDSADNLANSDRIEKYNQQHGGNFGGSGGFGSEFNQTVHLSENFAARSILHIADLERMISAIRTQTALGGKREIYLELKRSVLEGLKVKITTEDAQTQIEFLAANESVRSQIEGHSEELAGILRNRGINLKSLRTILISENESNDFQSNNQAIPAVGESNASNHSEDFSSENTFEIETETPVYRA